MGARGKDRAYPLDRCPLEQKIAPCRFDSLPWPTPPSPMTTWARHPNPAPDLRYPLRLLRGQRIVRQSQSTKSRLCRFANYGLKVRTPLYSCALGAHGRAPTPGRSATHHLFFPPIRPLRFSFCQDCFCFFPLELAACSLLCLACTPVGPAGELTS